MNISKKILFITFFIICISTNLAFATTGKVNIQATRIREENNTTSNIVTVIYENDEVEILEESGEWYKIKYKEYTGYVKKDFIKVDEENSQISSNTADSNIASTDVANNENVITINSEIYAKKLPNFSSNNIVKFEASKQVNKIAEINNWIQISDGVNTGWILKNKLQETQKLPQEIEEEKNQNTISNTTNTISNVTSNTISNTVSNTTSNTSSNTTNTTNSSSVNKTATITVETAKVREEASTTSNVLGFLDYGDEITLLEQSGDWYKINFNGKTGYIKNTLLKISDEAVSSRSLAEERKESENETEKEVIDSTTSSSEVVNYAKQYLGYPYIVGGKNPTTGFDCSGFTRYVFLNFGYSLGSTATSQTSIGKDISRENLEQGDLLLFLNEEKTSIGHTGIYIGNEEFIHSANPQRGVVIDNLNTNSYYNERFVSARRIVNN